MHFTSRGYLKLAHFVEKEIRRDLNLAKLERNIPLAGNEDEQAKVMGTDGDPGHADPPSARRPRGRRRRPASSRKRRPKARLRLRRKAKRASPRRREVQQSKVGEVDVIRPAIRQTTLDAAQNMTPQAAAAASLADSREYRQRSAAAG